MKDNGGICQNCFIKFNEYDEYQTLANKIQKELVTLYQQEFILEMKQEIKDEIEEYCFELEEHIEVVEIQPEEIIPKPTGPRKKITPMKPEVSSVKNFLMKQPQRPKKPYERRTSLSKVDRDVGLIVVYHDGVKHYQCEFCGKSDFTSRSRIKTHRQTHTTERNFMCQVS